MTDTKTGVDQFDEGDEVTVEMTGRVIETYPDDSMLVDLDGTEVMAYEGEYR